MAILHELKSKLHKAVFVIGEANQLNNIKQQIKTFLGSNPKFLSIFLNQDDKSILRILEKDCQNYSYLIVYSTLPTLLSHLREIQRTDFPITFLSSIIIFNAENIEDSSKVLNYMQTDLYSPRALGIISSNWYPKSGSNSSLEFELSAICTKFRNASLLKMSSNTWLEYIPKNIADGISVYSEIHKSSSSLGPEFFELINDLLESYFEHSKQFKSDFSIGSADWDQIILMSRAKTDSKYVSPKFNCETDFETAAHYPLAPYRQLDTALGFAQMPGGMFNLKKMIEILSNCWQNYIPQLPLKLILSLLSFIEVFLLDSDSKIALKCLPPLHAIIEKVSEYIPHELLDVYKEKIDKFFTAFQAKYKSQNVKNEAERPKSTISQLFHFIHNLWVKTNKDRIVLQVESNLAAVSLIEALKLLISEFGQQKILVYSLENTSRDIEIFNTFTSNIDTDHVIQILVISKEKTSKIFKSYFDNNSSRFALLPRIESIDYLKDQSIIDPRCCVPSREMEEKEIKKILENSRDDIHSSSPLPKSRFAFIILNPIISTIEDSIQILSVAQYFVTFVLSYHPSLSDIKSSTIQCPYFYNPELLTQQAYRITKLKVLKTLLTYPPDQPPIPPTNRLGSVQTLTFQGLTTPESSMPPEQTKENKYFLQTQIIPTTESEFDHLSASVMRDLTGRKYDIVDPSLIKPIRSNKTAGKLVSPYLDEIYKEDSIKTESSKSSISPVSSPPPPSPPVEIKPSEKIKSPPPLSQSPTVPIQEPSPKSPTITSNYESSYQRARNIGRRMANASFLSGLLLKTQQSTNIPPNISPTLTSSSIPAPQSTNISSPFSSTSIQPNKSNLKIDWVSLVYRYFQSQSWPHTEAVLIGQVGPPHQVISQYQMTLPNGMTFTGAASTKKQAKQIIAEQIANALKIKPD